ncbi:MAG: phosphate regulon transcriptional regulator PhoB [Pseudomonadota bacterium]
MSANILVVEDEAPIALLIRYNLQAEGFNVDVVDRAEDAEIAMQDQRPDLIVLDWMLPGISGIELCRRVRANRELRDIPIILLTARGEESDRIRGFETGADDYMPKPFSVPELIARVRAILRRSSPERVANVLEVGNIALNRDEHRVTRSGRDVRLGPTEFKLLEFFLESPGRVFTRTQLLDGVWGRDVYVDERTVDVHIGRLRKALIRGNEFNPIRTIRGSGYALTDKEQNIPN